LVLNGAKVHLISEPNRGVKLISKMLNITRIYNSATAVGNMRRILALVRDYADRRTVLLILNFK
jgi:alkylation response protein AidB-like acyl-CoA dehydrogenase